MLRTNRSFLSFIENLYGKQGQAGEIVLKTVAPGTFLLHQGSTVKEVFIIKKGITKCFFSEENGKEFIVEFLAEGEITGEIEIIRNMQCLCNIQALTEVEAYSLNVPFVRSLMEKDVEFNQLLLNELAERIVNTASRSSSQQLYAVEHGLRKILDFQASEQISISKEDMAAYLGITVRSLNRTLKTVQEDW